MTSAKVAPFGSVGDAEVSEVTIRSRAGAEARILTWGAVVRDLRVPTAAGLKGVVLGLNTLDDYRMYSPFFGAVPGRFANRIANGRFTLDGRTYDLSRNEGGVTTLHGGTHGFGTAVWRLADYSERTVTLRLSSPDGDQGFPGPLEAFCTYAMVEPATLRVELSAAAAGATVVNLTNHSYFNLDGTADVRDHEVVIHADAVTPTDAALIPTGEIMPVDGTPFDFRTPRTLRDAGGEDGQLYDINYVLSGAGPFRHAATVRGTTGVTLEVHTDQPGLQFYDAAKLHCPVPGLDGTLYGPHAGFCMETQLFPDAPNKPHFPSSVLRPGERYAHATEFRFS